MDSSSIILLFISLNNCLDMEDKTVFFMESKYHLRFDWRKDCAVLSILCTVKILYCL